MKHFLKLFIEAANDYASEHGVEELLQEIFPEASIGEVLADMYEAGLIPNDTLERFI